MEHVKEAFSKVKQDINILKKEASSLSEELNEIRQRLIEICDVLKTINKKNEDLLRKEFLNETISQKKEPPQNNIPYSCPFNTNNTNFPMCFMFHRANLAYPAHPAQRQNIPTDTFSYPTYPTQKPPYNALKGENTILSTGNRGVPTDRQTNQQTNQQTDKSSYNPEEIHLSKLSEDYIGDATKILDSLDNLKKEVRLKFKRLTDQEFSVFSTIYQLSEENGYTDYKNLSIKLGLTESSIRDYIGRLIKKGIPVEKTKINNKSIRLSISPNLKKIATLPTIFKLREL
ncbi:MAG TPA: hypothetical protein PLE51_00585 [Candidatus Pacearchaeota archaeon]|nr:hypothetical protein [Candidatus Pacearchaeota archaeon]HOR52144.1 hypothetical protein [Candidatus Pacearchaeota archaeon]HOU78969.1 hypothetical protein [Candidatus Pacearchaeota archaeon]HQF82607.1 hypothetical protein [Candidatus Pacearchaeota archaeon]HQI58026.1 hypothetical protein [Candidatus Pacearchaeota archaeon]